MSVRTWTLSILAVPVVYVLSFPFVTLSVGSKLPPWTEVYAKPWGWFFDTPLEKPLRNYWVWVVTHCQPWWPHLK
jgi:hypothetical protein